MNNYSKMSTYESYKFFCDVRDEKDNILSNIRKNPCEILMEVFDLCIDNFDGLDLEKHLPQLYSCLMQLYNASKEKPLIDSLDKNASIICDLREIFAKYKEKIKSIDCQLYYALLNFIDLLKTRKVCIQPK